MTIHENTIVYGRLCRALERLIKCDQFAKLIPEVRTNLVYAKVNANTPDDVLAVEGRITVVEGRPHPSGRPRFGASSHLARLILEVMKTKPEHNFGIKYRSCINFAFNDDIEEFLLRYVEEMGFRSVVVDRANEPDEVKTEEGASMGWKVQEAVRLAGGDIPKLIGDRGGMGKEPVFVLLGEHPLEVVNEVCEMAGELYG